MSRPPGRNLATKWRSRSITWGTILFLSSADSRTKQKLIDAEHFERTMADIILTKKGRVQRRDVNA